MQSGGIYKLVASARLSLGGKAIKPRWWLRRTILRPNRSRNTRPTSTYFAKLESSPGNHLQMTYGNSIFSIRCYRSSLSVWAFDDPTRDLACEPFVSGANEIIDLLIGRNGAKNVTLIFSANPFPAAAQIRWLREESGGNWYRYRSQEGWLCPALFKFFERAPKTIYALAEDVE